MSEYKFTCLSEIFDYLGLNEPKDGRLWVKVNLLRQVILYCHKWQVGNYNNWIERLSGRCCISTEKMRKDYLNFLIAEGIIIKLDDGLVRFIILSDKIEESATDYMKRKQEEKEIRVKKEVKKE